jgi:hypothetical protein
MIGASVYLMRPIRPLSELAVLARRPDLANEAEHDAAIAERRRFVGSPAIRLQVRGNGATASAFAATEPIEFVAVAVSGPALERRSSSFVMTRRDGLSRRGGCRAGRRRGWSARGRGGGRLP